MIKSKELKKIDKEISIDTSDTSKEIIPRIIGELVDLVGKYKEKRNLWEAKLKTRDDPRKPDLYAIIARLAMLDIIISDLESLLIEIMK
ncbi:MAG: hypothetical protein JSV04_08290 [Candidatus Heimdallarchaeota archaeon]|nr:MAG: hypothetical protein JSV04_08290 [Candidatus Heimdallarchaeota archaeon]